MEKVRKKREGEKATSTDGSERAVVSKVDRRNL